MKPLFNFAKNRCAAIQDAEDVTQEICTKLFRTLLLRNDITEPEKFAWTIAHNTLANYYRSRSQHGNSIPIDGFADLLSADGDFTTKIEEAESIAYLHREIAYLSKTRRRIVVMHYFENKRQQDIADILNLPLGTIKWHLSESKTELKKRMVTMKTNTDIKFNPVTLSGICTNGSAGTRGGNHEYLRSALAQNILYCTRNEAKTINEIADAMGVSPVYIESEAEFLEENGFMLKRGKGYIANILINIGTTEKHRQQSEMYEKAADLFAPALFDALADSIKTNKDGVFSGYTFDLKMTSAASGHGEMTAKLNDLNFVMWALIPYITARSGKPDNKVTFEEAATIRPDGGMNICSCTITEPNAEPIKYHESLAKMGGPSWIGDEKFLLWLIDTEWGGNRVGNYHPDHLYRDRTSLQTFFDSPLGEDDMLRMAERGYITREVLENGTRDSLNIVWLTCEANNRLLSIANGIRAKYAADFDALKSSLITADVPEHMRKAAAYGLQHTFLSDGFFIIYLLNKLVESGKLKLPPEHQRKSLGAVVVTG
jgi:RNA polymerase sigma factor (sigma-70 family)